MTTFPNNEIFEIEQKLRVTDLTPVITFLESQNANFIGTYHVFDSYYDTATRALLRQERVLKLRQKSPIRPYPGDPINTMSVKTQTKHRDIRDEIEIPVDDLTKTQRFIHLLGFHQIATVTKVRSRYELDNFNILLDAGNLGNFIEVEILSSKPEESADRIESFVGKLPFEFQLEPYSHLQLALEYQRKNKPLTSEEESTLNSENHSISDKQPTEPEEKE